VVGSSSLEISRTEILGLKKSGDTDSLLSLLGSDQARASPELRRTIAFALYDLRDRRSVEALMQLAQHDADTQVKRIAMRTLANIGARPALPVFLDALQSKDINLRLQAIDGLAKTRANEAVRPLIELRGFQRGGTGRYCASSRRSRRRGRPGADSKPPTPCLVAAVYAYASPPRFGPPRAEFGDRPVTPGSFPACFAIGRSASQSRDIPEHSPTTACCSWTRYRSFRAQRRERLTKRPEQTTCRSRAHRASRVSGPRARLGTSA
jgi:HEAT repeats